MEQTLPLLTPSDTQELVATRRDLHQHPELAFEEVRTSGVVRDRLRELGIPFREGVGRTGVVALLGKGAAGRPSGGNKVVLLRADMDALPIQEENEVPYRSSSDGRMHACGHDCHTATLLTVARALKREETTLPGTVKLVFQPAEEGFSGADAMIRDGVLEDPRPQAAFAYHVWQDLDLGQVGIPTGPMLAAVDFFTVTLRGKGAHAAAPETGVDPVVAAAYLTTALQTIVSRNVNPLLQAVVSVTRIHAGTAFNVIPETAEMRGTVRVFDPDLWEELPRMFDRVARNTAAAMGCSIDIDYRRLHRPTINDAAMAQLAREVAAEMVGAENVREDVRTMGGEDFSAFLHHVPGCFLAVGSRNAKRGLTYGHHHPRFDVDEKAMEIGAEILVRIARKYLGG